VDGPSVEDVARVLLRNWDPLGVAETDEHPEHEYLFEARQLRSMLARGASLGVIAAYHGSRSLGRSNTGRDRAAAAAVRNLAN